MIVSERRRRLSADKEVKDLEAGDCVHEVGRRRKGWIESVDPVAGTAIVMWDGTVVRDVVPFGMLRKIRAGGSDFDRRRKQ
jgi:hypothetical protein